MKDTVAFPSMVIAAYAEHLIEGRRVVVFGDSTSDLPDLLIERGARLVHVYDEDLSRVAEASARGTNKDISFAPLGQSGVLARDGAFDFGVVLNVAAFEDGKKLITRLRRALAPRGIAIVATPNPEATAPLIADAEDASGPSYYDLYEWVTAEFDEVKMLGQLPVCGYAVVDFGAEGEPDFALDTTFMPNGAEEPDWYLALASHFPVSADPFTIVQVPRAGLTQNDAEAPNTDVEELVRNNAQLEAEVARLRKVERQTQKSSKDDERLAELEQKLREREQTLGELEERLAQTTTRCERAEAEATALQSKLKEEAKAPPIDPRQAAVASAELRSLEQQLSERAKETKRLNEELRVADKLGQELISELETLKQTSAGTHPHPELEELKERLRRAEETEARRVADLTAAQWTIEQLRGQLQEAALNAPSGNG